jgi:DNA polymerase III delta' subunit
LRLIIAEKNFFAYYLLMFSISHCQKNHWQNITNRVSHGNLPHALLFSGLKGLGKYDFARAFAEFVLCQNRHNDRSCGSCRSCVLLSNNTHPDLYLIEPEGDSEVIKIEQIREVIEQLSQTSSQNGYKIIIISPAEKLNLAASNALLKTLEEPTANVLFILITNNHLQLLPTIRSRCQIITFYPDKEMENSLPSDLEQKLQQLMIELLDKKITPLKCAEAVADYEIAEFLRYTQGYLTEIIKVKFGISSRVPDHRLKDICASLSVDNLLASLTKINELSIVARNSNINKQLLFDNVCLIVSEAG